jgi:hypothetical protein
VLDLFLELIFVFKDIFESIVLLSRIASLYFLKKFLLLHDEFFYLLAFEIFIQISFVEMSSELLGVLSEFILAFLYLSDKRQKWMIIFLLIEFLVKEGNYVSTRFFLDLYNNIKHFLLFSRAKSNFDRFNRY